MYLYEQIQYKAGKLVTGALHLTSSEKINKELGWESIRDRIDFLGLSLFHKINYCETRTLIRSCLTSRIMRNESRQVGNYNRYPNYVTNFLIHTSHIFQKNGEQYNAQLGI